VIRQLALAVPELADELTAIQVRLKCPWPTTVLNTTTF